MSTIQFIVLSTILLFLSSCSNDNKIKTDTSDKLKSDIIRAENLKIDSNGLSKLQTTIKTVHGNIVFKFYPREAPNTTTRIIELIQKGFYDGLIFHRVIPNFVIQTGDPTGTGTSGSGVKLKAEFNKIQHIKGTVAMARSNDKDSADSQFYIALTTLPHLDEKYTVIGQVTKGLEILSKITIGDKILSTSIKR